jgi:DNA topoisomerase VI subunit A
MNNQRHKSQNVRNQEMRDTKMLQNFNKYQQIWQTNLNRFEEVRDKLNDKALSKNAKLNSQ